jgi:uridine phosphorylase
MSDMPPAADAPILEFDPAPVAFIEPSRYIKRRANTPYAVACFFQDVLGTLVEKHQAQVIWHLKSEIGKSPVYQVMVGETPVLAFHPGVGAPLAAGCLEEMIAFGCTKFIACGGAGVLESSIVMGHPIIVTEALRDEGTSYHYLPPARTVAAAPEAVAALEAVLQAHNVAYLLGKSWTTDGLYRETRDRIARRRAEGCVAVEMEAAAFFAVAQFRQVTCGQLLYGGDDVGGAEHDMRDWLHQGDIRAKLFWLAAEACARL